MNVRELIEMLSDVEDQDADVILQKDAEGNGYSPLDAVDDEAVYVPESTWGGEVYSLNWTAEEAAMDEKEWEEITKRPRCVVLVPVN